MSGEATGGSVLGGPWPTRRRWGGANRRGWEAASLGGCRRPCPRQSGGPWPARCRRPRPTWDVGVGGGSIARAVLAAGRCRGSRRWLRPRRSNGPCLRNTGEEAGGARGPPRMPEWWSGRGAVSRLRASRFFSSPDLRPEAEMVRSKYGRKARSI